MTPEQQSLLISLISLALVFISPLISFLSYNRQRRKDENDDKRLLEKRFDSIETAMNELTTSIKLLNQKIEQLNKDNEKNNKFEETMAETMHHHDVELENHETRISKLEHK